MEVKKKLPELLKGATSYDLLIPLEVQTKINRLCARIADVEWSGTLFYTVEGGFDPEDEDKLFITVIDLFLQDVGSAAYTEFNQSPDLAGYMVDHLELLEDNVYMGLIHSHNNMSTFFSGTDLATLREEGAEKHNFLSLIVNNWHKYTAAITRKIQSTQRIIEKFSYESFYERSLRGNRERVVTGEVIEYFICDIHFERSEVYDLTELDKRIDTVVAEKKRLATASVNYAKTPTIVTPAKTNVPANQPVRTYYNEFEAYPPAALPKTNGQKAFEFEDWPSDKESGSEDEFDPFSDAPYGKVHFNRRVIDSILRQLVTGSVLVANDEKIDIAKFAVRSKTLFDKRFQTVEDFESWAEFFIDYLLLDAEDKKIIGKYGEDTMRALCAYELMERLEKYQKDNPYILSMIKMIENYLL